MEDKELNIQALNKVLEMYNEMEMQLLIEISKHFLINDEFINSDYWRIQKLQEMGVFNQQVIKYIASYTKTTPDLVKKGLQQLGVDTFNINKLKGAFEDEMISIDPNILLENGVIQTLINTQYNTLNNSLITLSDKVIKATKQAYVSIVEETYLKTSSGAYDYQTAIRESINELSKKGLSTLTYETIDGITGEVTGIRRYDVEGAVRRELLTNTRNLSNNINKEIIDKLKPKYIKLSEHEQCRPQHFDWQGTIIKSEELVEITHYGEVDGLGGINCRHYFEPYFGDKRDKEEKQYTQKQCDIAYKESQKQRYLERGVRTWQRKVNMYKADKDKEMLDKSKDKLEMWQNKYFNYCELIDVKPDYTRIYTTIKSKH